MIRKEDPVIAEAKSLIGKKIPVSEVFDVNTGENYSEQVENGKVLLIYLVSGCDACKKEIQLINEANIESNSETRIFGVMFEKNELVNEYVKKHNINFPILIDKDGKILKELNLKYFPTNFKLENGIIEKASFGSPKNQKDLSELIISKR
jgi:peroxiredoxin